MDVCSPLLKLVFRSPICMSRTVSFSILILCMSLGARASVLDSLSEELSKLGEREFKRRAELHNEIGWNFRDSRPDSALYHATIAYRIADEHDLTHLKIQALNYIGVAYRNLSNYTKAFEKYLEALNLSEKSGDGEQRGYALINLGNLYWYQTNFQGAIRYFIQALDQSQELANRRMMAYCYINLGRCYKELREYGQAELYLQQAIDIRKEQEDVYGQISAEIDLADVYQMRGDLELASKYYLDIVSRIDPEENPRALGACFNALAKLSLRSGNPGKAEDYATHALEISKKVNSRFDEKNDLQVFSEVYAKQGDYVRAYDYHVKYSQLNQQLFSEENIRKIEQMRNQHTIEKQEAENEFLRKQKELDLKIIGRQKIIIVLSAVGILLLVVIVIISRRALLVRKRLNLQIQKQHDKIQTDKNLIEQQANKLQELDEAKSRFFANVSHDLRTPLSLIIGNLELAQDDDDSAYSPASKKSLDTAIKNSKRLLYLTDEINDLTKLEEGKISLRLEPVKLGSYLQMLSEMFISSAEYKGVTLKVENRLSNFDHAAIDPRQFEKIFYNLVSNAIRHTRTGDSITVRSYKDAGKITVEIEDSGEGIAPDSLPFIFDRFFQSKHNVHRTREGLGIGLALVKELTELHHGQIAVESELSKGTKFKLIFPEADRTSGHVESEEMYTYIKERKHLYDELDRESAAGMSLPKQEEEKRSILLVDDHPEIRYHIRQILEDDFHVIEAAHGLEALELLKYNEADLIITDLMMPWMDGFELIESINANEELRKIPILVVSARISDNDHEKVLYQGVNDFLQKPFQRKELVLRINNLLQQRTKWEENGSDVLSNLFASQDVLSVEKDILAKVEALVMERIDDPNLSVFHLADAMAASERQVYRLVKKITGMTPHEYIMEIRLKYVDYLIRKNKVRNATEAAKSIGQKNVTLFSRQFEKKFGKKPSDILNVN